MKKKLKFSSILALTLSILFSIMSPSSGHTLSLPIQDNQDAESSEISDIYLYVGSPLILSQDKISPLDPENLDVAATVIDNRTLVPLRALSEYFKADVSYNAEQRKAIINYNGKQYIFPIGEKKYIIKGKSSDNEVLLDTKTSILNQRTMVPLKVICEDILGRKVSYYNKIIAISDADIKLEENKKLADNIKQKIGAAVKATSLEQIKAVMSQPDIRRENLIITFSEAIDSSASKVADASVSNTPLSDTANSSSDYSTTNTQVKGIDEADIVKTDGKYIYIAGNNAVRIVSADSNGVLKETAVIKLPQNKTVAEIYIDENRLVLIGNRYETQNTTLPEQKVKSDDAIENNLIATTDIVPDAKLYMPYRYKNYSFVDIYDTSDHQNPKFIKGHEMEGNYQSSRKNDDIVYLVTNSYMYNDIILPYMRDTVVSDKHEALSISDIMLLPEEKSPGYLIISAINISNNEKTQVEAITAASHTMYMNNSSLYLVSNNYNGKSTITKFNIDGMKIGYAGSGNVDGYVLNQFSMDEHNGYFRIATTWNSENNLFILDNSLNVCGSVTGLAKGEQIYSVRFMGDKGYIVTYRTIDPLFVFDLSDPKSPKVTGELKIPGFSNYLHPVGENLILGIGQETYEIYKKDSTGKEIVVGTRQGGIKLSLFDVSDMGKPKEISNYVLGDSGSYTEAFYNHKSVMFDKTNNNVVFDAYITDTSNNWSQGAAVINLNNNAINLKGILEYIQPEVYGNYIPYGRRNLYIGDTLYYIQDGIVSSYNYKTLEKIDTLMLK
jgi:inhibitor of cysteine peptidase